MLRIVVGVALGAIGLLAGAVLDLPGATFEALAERTLPVLGFLVAITVVAELARGAGVFDRLASWALALSRGRTAVLWAATVVLATVCTAFLSLDTTAVLLTLVVVGVVLRAGVAAVPFLLVTIWLANTASLFLPVSNLTNLLAERAPGGDTLFPGPLLPAAVVAVVVPVALVALLHRRALAGRFDPPVDPRPEAPVDRVLLLGAGAIVLVLLPFLAVGVEPWIPSTWAAAALLALTVVRRPRSLRPGLVPLPVLALTIGLFIAVEVATLAGLGRVLTAVAGEGEGPLELLRLAATGVVAANGVNNLPAYLALEAVAEPSPVRLAVLLVAANAGPLLTPWASLATLLALERVRAMGLVVPWRTFLLPALVVVPLTVGAAALTVALLS